MKQRQQQTAKQGLNQRQRQSLKLLSMSAMELDQYVDVLYDENPLLYRDEPIRVTHADLFAPREDYARTLTVEPADAIDDLFLELHASTRDPLTLRVGDYLIASLDERGYLDEGWEDAAAEFDLSENALEQIVEHLQETMEPAGILARDLQECLLIQAERQFPGDALVRTLLESYLEEIASGDLTSIATGLGADLSEVETAVGKVRGLQPNPLNGSRTQVPVTYRIPDVEFVLDGDELSVVLLDRGNGVSVNPIYIEARKQGALTPEERAQMKGYYNEARELVSAIEQRNRTMLRVAGCLGELQKDHFYAGAPLTGVLERDVADRLGISVSTVSRTIKDKYYLFQGEVYAMSDLLSPKLRTGISRDELQFLMQSLIAMENRERPLSDAFIAQYCTANGHPVSRRTIAKYRQELSIPSSDERRKLA